MTELNAGRKTAGVDGAVVVTAPGKAFLAASVQIHGGQWAPKPVKRVYVAKANGKQRPLGIPVIVDRVRQAQVVNALEPEWEARFEPKSYGWSRRVGSPRPRKEPRKGLYAEPRIKTLMSSARLCAALACRAW